MKSWSSPRLSRGPGRALQWRVRASGSRQVKTRRRTTKIRSSSHVATPRVENHVQPGSISFRTWWDCLETEITHPRHQTRYPPHHWCGTTTDLRSRLRLRVPALRPWAPEAQEPSMQTTAMNPQTPERPGVVTALTGTWVARGPIPTSVPDLGDHVAELLMLASEHVMRRDMLNVPQLSRHRQHPRGLPLRSPPRGDNTGQPITNLREMDPSARPQEPETHRKDPPTHQLHLGGQSATEVSVPASPKDESHRGTEDGDILEPITPPDRRTLCSA